ncbi:hypothetical protein NEOLEDRAFT_1140597 [Neolentinus lepideus HHB14362 ss-1]|uniref:Uncharacterized protein n=1 Tax=Neolentinus lepideus HHB14362 ss-1 TaxID=1314782 RepID=A0A165P480_9AGAM|nr:hypothetical protein NEOLEDRAFT_1140597 [Neolentinus lepideus HHB14362 ss-1]
MAVGAGKIRSLNLLSLLVRDCIHLRSTHSSASTRLTLGLQSGNSVVALIGEALSVLFIGKRGPTFVMIWILIYPLSCCYRPVVVGYSCRDVQ